MALTPIQLPPGLERNNTPYDTTGRWWDMNLVRWQSGTMRPVGGWTKSTTTALDSAIRKIFVYRQNNNNQTVLIGTDGKLYTDQSGYTDITPSGFTPLSNVSIANGYGTLAYGAYTYGTARPGTPVLFPPYGYWTMSNWGEDVILTANSDGRLYYYVSATSTVAPTVISAAPTGVNAVIVTDERHVMVIGAGSGGLTDRTVGWSSREDYTDWNFSSTTNTAGFQQLASRTPLLRGVKVKEGVLIFSSTDVFLSQYVGLPFVYGFNRISDAAMMHPDSIAAFNGKAVWLGRNGFQLYNGGFVQPLECPLLDDILSDFNPIYGAFRCHASHHGLYPEVWFFYASTNSLEADRYVIWNYVENWWAWGSLSRSAMSAAEVYRYPYMGASDGNIYQHEDGWTNDGTSRVGTIYAETGALGIGNGDQFMNVGQVLAASGSGYDKLSLTMIAQNTPEGAERTFGPYTMRSNGYADCRVTGREARIRFSAIQDGEWGVGKVRLDLTPGGGR
ncbi:hypothetical protein UFOVP62_10 [uncultured Caudovirales phage]|uniref:Uncharacterized protein n=1 Tax=uncultured Caudovirales phage TaxID=2100421 RepID=A0A6J5KU30_9CAUD|nr:hypothetical protein UFOVP62_10 [uncultured Caudovirales phage]